MRWIEATRNFDQKKKKSRRFVVAFFSLLSRRDLEEKVSHIFSPVSLSPTCRQASEVAGSSLALYLHIEVVVVFLYKVRLRCVGNVRPNKNEDGRQRVPTSGFFHFISNFLHCRKYDGMARRAVEIRSLIFFLFLYLAA